MGARFDRCCKKCGKHEVEEIEDWISDYCGRCNDGLIDKANERREWDHFHTSKK